MYCWRVPDGGKSLTEEFQPSEISAVPMGVSQRGNIWLLGVLVAFLLLFGADLYARRPQVSPELVEKEQRTEFLRTWKPALPIRSQAPDFKLKDTHGRVRSLSEFRSKPALLLFYSDDRRSRTFAREMQKLWKYIGQSRMHSLVVVNFSRKAALAFARETKDASVYLFEDPDHHPVRDKYGAAPGPNAWVIDRKGRIRHASAPIHTDRNPDQDFHGVYRALQALAPRPMGKTDLPIWAAGSPRPPADED
jgi:peroxiredoxin